MEAFCRPASLADLKALVQSLNQQGESIRVADAFLVDIKLNACGETYETLQQFAVTVDLEGIPVRTINLEGLLRTKQTLRDKDVADRHILEMALETFRQQTGNT